MSKPTHEQNVESYFGEVISTYTRAQALEDGVLVDAGPMAEEAGFTGYITP
jgi:type I site-specific restriction endonuclease